MELSISSSNDSTPRIYCGSVRSDLPCILRSSISGILSNYGTYCVDLVCLEMIGFAFSGLFGEATTATARARRSVAECLTIHKGGLRPAKIVVTLSCAGAIPNTSDDRTETDSLTYVHT